MAEFDDHSRAAIPCNGNTLTSLFFTTSFTGQWPVNVWDDPEDPHTAEAPDPEDGGGGGEGAADPGEGEALPGAEAHPGQAAWTRGGWAAADLPADPQGEDQTDEGMY